MVAGVPDGPLLTPAFASEVEVYSVALPYAVPSLRLSPQTTDPEATVRIRLRGEWLADEAEEAAGSGLMLPLVVGENRIEIEVTAADGLTMRVVTLVATRAERARLDRTAARQHLFPLFATGGGFRSQLRVSEVVGKGGRCALTLHGSGLDAVRFTAQPRSVLSPLAKTGSEAAGVGIRLEADDDVLLRSISTGELALGYAKLTCDELVAAQLLLTQEGVGGEPIAMAHKGSVRAGRTMAVPPLPTSLRLALALANDGAEPNRCEVESAQHQATVELPPGDMVFRWLDEIIPRSGSGVTVTCEHPAALQSMLMGGAVFTALPGIVLAEAMEAMEEREEREEREEAEETMVVADAAAESLLPLVLDGDGFRSWLMVTSLAEGANRCTLRLSRRGGLTATDFTTGRLVERVGTDGFRIMLAGAGSQALLASFVGDRLDFGHATLACDGPASLHNLVIRTGADGPTGMMVLDSAQPARTLRFRAPSGPQRLGLALSNSGRMAAACQASLTAADGRAVPLINSEAAIRVAARSTSIHYLDELFALPKGFGGGVATLSCDQLIGGVGVPLAGPVFTAVPPVIPGLEPTLEP